MRMDGYDDILTAAQRRQVGRRGGGGGGGGHPPPQQQERRPPYPADHVLRIDNYTTGGSGMSPTSPSSFSPTTPRRRYEPKGFVAEVAGDRRREPRVAVPLFLEEVPYSRNSLPPLVPVEVQGREVVALLHTAVHVSYISTRLVAELGARQDVLSDAPIPPSPLLLAAAATGPSVASGSPWLVEGKLRYVEMVLKDTKHVAQLFVARDLPADLVLGVDFLKKAQVRIDFPNSCIMLPNVASSSQDIKLSFLSTKELNQHKKHTAATTMTPPAGTSTRAYSSNY
ncbi:uncharacterized protein LOC143039363 isoform X2 [Oratosquilla oratoria]|uniref:uncharacterized protein LOC143039363 isoform X2 n=1 Tax=Oratosquilla oratoria TaxID=337810 RepID=UPI003F76CC42